MRVLVTGASGFLGTNLVHHLASRGHEVRAFMLAELDDPAFRRRLEALDPPGEARPERKVETVFGGFDDPALIDRLVEETEAVVHTAGTVRGSEPGIFQRLNPGLVGKLAAARTWRRDHRLVHVSSVAAQGPGIGPEPVTEDAPPAPRGLYGGSKRRAEEVLLGAGLPARLLVVRPCSILGPHDPNFLDVFQYAAKGWYFKLGSASKSFQLVYVRDLCRAIDALLERLGGADLPAWRSGPIVQVAHPAVLDHEAWKGAFEVALGRSIRTIWLRPWATWLLGAVTAWVDRLTGRPQLLGPDKMADMQWPWWVHSTARFEELCEGFAFTPHATALAETAAWYTRNKMM